MGDSLPRQRARIEYLLPAKKVCIGERCNENSGQFSMSQISANNQSLLSYITKHNPPFVGGCNGALLGTANCASRAANNSKGVV